MSNSCEQSAGSKIIVNVNEHLAMETQNCACAHYVHSVYSFHGANSIIAGYKPRAYKERGHTTLHIIIMCYNDCAWEDLCKKGGCFLDLILPPIKQSRKLLTKPQTSTRVALTGKLNGFNLAPPTLFLATS